MHFLFIPLLDSYTEKIVFEVVSQVLNALFGICMKNQLFSVAADEASSMTGKIQGAATCFQQVIPPSFLRILCADHQFDLVANSVMKIAAENLFQSEFLPLVSYLRRQCPLQSPMGFTCSAVCQPCWLSLGSSIT